MSLVWSPCSKRMLLSPCRLPLHGIKGRKRLAYLPQQQSLQMMECSMAKPMDAGISSARTPTPHLPLRSINAQQRINIKPSASSLWKLETASSYRSSALLTQPCQRASVFLPYWNNLLPSKKLAGLTDSEIFHY